MGRARLLAAALLAHLALGAAAIAQPAGLDAMRAEALDLVNAARAEAGLRELTAGPALGSAAQDHAEDMIARDYYDHTSPEGETVRDRVLDRGGSPWALAAENIAECRGCEAPPGLERVRAFQSGWMQSPGHRENILREGLSSFGFGIAHEGGRVVAVQTFAGPGGNAEAELLDPETAAERMAEAINARRETPLELAPPLSAMARRLAEEAEVTDGATAELDLPDDLFGLLPEGAGGWRGLSVAAALCGGCGAAPVASDVERFAEEWTGAGSEGAFTDPQFTHLGFAIEANGEGRKIAVAVLGRR